MYSVKAWLVEAAGVGVGVRAQGTGGGGGCVGRVVFASDSIRTVAHCLYALRDSLRSRRSGDCADPYCRNGSGVMDEADVKARVIFAFGLCFEPCA